MDDRPATIRDVMTADVRTLREATPVEDALDLLITHHISGAPVVDDRGRLVGVITEADLLKLFWEHQARTVGEVMTRNPESFHVDAPLSEVVDCLMTHHFRRVLIRDQDNVCVGLISRSDLMPSILANLKARRARG